MKVTEILLGSKMRSLILIEQELNIYNEFHKRADQFLDKTVCAEKLRDYRDYIPGSQKISYYHQKLSQTEDVQIEELNSREYEKSIIERLSESSDRNNLLVTIGAVGAGKTTCSDEVTRILKSRLSKAMLPEESKPFLPLVISCIHMIGSDSELQLLKTLLTSVLDRIMAIWLQSYKMPDQSTQNLLQCLILINLVGNWAFTQNRHTFPHIDTLNPLLDLPLQDFFQYDPKSKRFQEDLLQLRPLTYKIQEYYRELIEDVERARNAASCALGLLEELTENRLIPKVVIIDNLDQLPTKTIQQIIESLYSISAVNPKVKFLVPLRPSSLGVNRYTQNITYVYHNGPCTFYFIFHRLKRYILSRSAEELSRQEIYAESPKCVTPQEISALISASYIYACLMLVGSEGTVSLSTAIREVRKSVHEDHKHIISTIHLPLGTTRAVSDMIGAIVGLSGRYAVAQVSQFFADLYHSPEILYEIFREQESQRKVRITYKRLVTTLFFSQNRKISLGRYLNLFTPVESTSNPRRPSLVKMLILSHIEDNRSITFSTLAKKLAVYGVPTDIAIRSLVKLHDERRRLVWFSSNQAVQGQLYGDDECTVISEQGMRYLHGLVQTFDYLWVCSAQIRGETDADPIFPVKLNRYIFLIRELLEIELKQSTFFVCGGHESVSPIGTPNNHITLRLLLRSIPQAVKSSKIAFAVTDSGTQYAKNLASYLVIVVQLLQQAMVEYRYCFGGPYYVIHYRKELDSAVEVLKELLETMGNSLEEQNYLQIDHGVRFLSKQIKEYEEFDRNLLRRPTSPDLNLVTELSRHGRFVLPDKKMKQIDALELDKTEKDLLEQKQAELAYILTARIPRFQELSAKLLSITDQLAICVKTSERVGVATGRETYEWLRKEQEWWHDVVRQFEDSRYVVEAQNLSRSDADLAKNRFNSRVKLLEKLCAELDVSPPLKLSRALWA